jgi:hypothetical protein
MVYMLRGESFFVFSCMLLTFLGAQCFLPPASKNYSFLGGFSGSVGDALIRSLSELKLSGSISTLQLHHESASNNLALVVCDYAFGK